MILSLSTMLLTSTALAQYDSEKAITFETRGGESYAAFEGEIKVPENRANKNSKMIPVRYVRFPATGEKKGPPIFYLSGGPGGSGIQTAKNRRTAMFMALREYGDVIAVDQRGTGASRIYDQCRSNQIVPAAEKISDEEYLGYYRRGFMECLARWKAEGIDVEGYTTTENARDLNDLRKHFGADKMVLWGISYGSHLAMATIKEFDEHIDRVIIASAEGMNQTVKMPARTDDYFDRVQEAVNTQPAAKTMYGDIKSMIARVHAKLDKEPVLLKLPQRDGSTKDYMFHRRDMQHLASGMVSDPIRTRALLAMYNALDNGVTEPIASLMARFITPEDPVTYDVMSSLMDIASGMTADRKAAIAEEAQTSLLKDYLNFSYHLDGLAPELDLGDGFRAKPASDIPLLLLSGTLDGRTYIESQLEATEEMKNRTAVTVVNAGHNLFMLSPKVQETINLFMEDKPVTDTTIVVDLPDMSKAR
ncbi:alpha/beta hydrolase [Kordiimonas sp. SCSIO 12603]|nr:alpha/beta hydrolase [Kordiimonas sp. SCSIO 12603]